MGSSDSVGGRDCDIEEIGASEGAAAYGTVSLSGTTCCIGSAESPIEID